ncbi:MAG TPA: hypothetical protein PKE55_06985 [Kiritimatiellia bacterium]|nr:hypothetical protein [Kiritimatiellia bacterium]
MKMRMLIGFVLASWVGVSSAHAERGWTTVATLTAGGDAKEVTFTQEVSRVMITCTEGSVIINTVVVREGTKTTPHRVGTRINKDESQQIRVGDRLNVTGLRISDDGRGEYTVKVRR